MVLNLKGKFINGLANGLLEVYYSDGSIKVKTLFSNGVHLKMKYTTEMEN